MFFFCLQIDGSITGRASKRQFTVECLPFGHIILQQTPPLSILAASSTVYNLRSGPILAVSKHSPEFHLRSKTKIEPDLRLTVKNSKTPSDHTSLFGIS